MKRFIFISILLFLLSSCSLIDLNNEMTHDQGKYVNDLIVCDCKSTNFKVINQEELNNFFISDEKGTVTIQYNYQKRKGVDLKREIELKKVMINDREFYYAKFDRFTFPGSDCDDLKEETRFFE
jgi:hypothetical protein